MTSHPGVILRILSAMTLPLRNGRLFQPALEHRELLPTLTPAFNFLQAITNSTHVSRSWLALEYLLGLNCPVNLGDFESYFVAARVQGVNESTRVLLAVLARQLAVDHRPRIAKIPPRSAGYIEQVG